MKSYEDRMEARNEHLERKWERIEEKLDMKENEECRHDSCDECNGTGTKKNREGCVHLISCPCKKCSPWS